MAKPHLTPERLREYMRYDPVSGIFTRRIRRKGHALNDVGTPNKLGYIRIGIDGRLYYAQRLAWLYVHGVWPQGYIDHIDGQPANNAIHNLRDVDALVNSQNRHVQHRRNSTNCFGAWRSGKRFTAMIRVGGKRISLGVFDTAEEASAAYLEAKRKYHAGFIPL